MKDSAPHRDLSSSTNLKAFKAAIAYVGITIFPFTGRAEFVVCVIFMNSSISASQAARSEVNLLTNQTF